MTEKDKLFELLVKELNSDLTEEEKNLIRKSLQNDDSFSKQYHSLKEFWNRIHPPDISHRIIDKTEKKLGFTYQNKPVKNNHFIYKIAVVVLLLISLGLSGIFFMGQQNTPTLHEYHSYSNEVNQFVLSDGTKVWLNSDSYLLTMEPFNGEFRLARLYGEAYFEVAHNPKLPFIIKTPSLKTKVLGTAFNLCSWPNNKIQEIELYEGRIKLEPEQNDINAAFLEPGQRAHFNPENKKMIISQTDADNRAAWRNGILNFYNEELFYIVLELERKFDTRILISDNEAGKLRFTAEFTDEPLEKILLLLSEAKTFNYHISNQGVLIRSVK
ncbi:FecR family protein [Mariniphaga sp.]|uniref:FecR family protein n=1 Tax=Mariniphaga sp. TaxID=1954475 RepID=UPI0035623323